MRRKPRIILLITVVILLAGTSVSWWNQDWDYRKPINVTEQSGQNLNNYQLELSLDTASLISEGKMQSDCSDMRFVNETDNGKLDYWIKNGCNTASTEVVVEFPDLESGAKERIHFYYGNSSVSSESSPYSTYLFFDDFEKDLSKWRTNGGISLSNSHLVVDTGNSGATWQGAYSKNTFSSINGDIEVQLKDLSHTYNYDDNNLNIGLVDPAEDPDLNPDGADPKISIEHTESYSGSRAEFVCGGSDTPSITPDYSNSNWSIIYRGGSAEIHDGTETVSSSNICDTDYELMFSIEKESGPDRLEVGKVTVSRYTTSKPSMEIGPEERNEICDRRGTQNQCIIDSEKQVSGKQITLESIFSTTENSRIESYPTKSNISVSNTSIISGLWTGNIDFSATEITIKPGASFTPSDRILLNETR